MAKARALDKRRKSIQNIRKITRTMELISTARFKRAMDRATAATAYTDRITALVKHLAGAGLDVSHPLLEDRPEPDRAVLLVLSANRGMCAGYNGNVFRLACSQLQTLDELAESIALEVSGKRGISSFKFRGIETDEQYTHFEDQPAFAEVDELATRYLDQYIAGEIDRVDVVYTKFTSIAKQETVVETLLPLGRVDGLDESDDEEAETGHGAPVDYDMLPSPESILEEVIPTSFRVKLFKCFLDAAVSEQIARMVAMKAATENADDIIRQLSMTYNRARQGQITGELLEIIGGAEALNS